MTRVLAALTLTAGGLACALVGVYLLLGLGPTLIIVGTLAAFGGVVLELGEAD